MIFCFRISTKQACSEWSNKSGVATFCCFSQSSALSTEKFIRGASSWEHEFFTIYVDRQYELNGIGRILPGKCAHTVMSSISHIYKDNINTSIID